MCCWDHNGDKEDDDESGEYGMPPIIEHFKEERLRPCVLAEEPEKYCHQNVDRGEQDGLPGVEKEYRGGGYDAVHNYDEGVDYGLVCGKDAALVAHIVGEEGPKEHASHEHLIVADGAYHPERFEGPVQFVSVVLVDPFRQCIALVFGLAKRGGFIMCPNPSLTTLRGFVRVGGVHCRRRKLRMSSFITRTCTALSKDTYHCL